MNWLDIVFIIVWLLFLAVGAKMGSLWTGACVLGGFVGAFLTDYYALQAAHLMGGFAGSEILAGILIFAGGLLVILVPAYFLSKISSILFLGVIDSAFGLVTGALTGLIALALAVLLMVPASPRIEKTKVWKKSGIVRPFHKFVEELFYSPRFHPRRMTKSLKKKAMKKIKPLNKQVKKALKKLN